MATLMPNGLPDDVYANRSERKKKLAEALRKQSTMPQGQMVGGIYVAPSITQYLSSGLHGYNADKLDRQADTEYETGVKQKQERITNAQQKYLEALRPQSVQTGEAKQPFEPNQMDRFGTTMQGQQQATTPIMGQRQPTPEEMYAAQMQFATELQDPNAMMQAANSRIGRAEKIEDRGYNEQREDKVYTRNRGDQVADREDTQEFQRIAMKEQQGFQLTQQERQFAQAWKMQQSSQGFQAGQQSRSQAFQAGQNQLERNSKQAANGGIDWKYDAASDEFVAPPTPEYPMGRRSGNISKSNAGKSMDYIINQFRGDYDAKGNPIMSNGKPKNTGALNEAMQGGMMGVTGIAGKVFDSQDQRRFDNLKEQMSTELRTLFRIPGEGTLSDKEQAQYGIQLPDVKNSKETNEKILNDVETRIKLRNNLNANPLVNDNNSNVRTVDW